MDTVGAEKVTLQEWIVSFKWSGGTFGDVLAFETAILEGWCDAQEQAGFKAPLNAVAPAHIWQATFDFWLAVNGNGRTTMPHA